MTEDQLREGIVALHRIATALEAGNAANDAAHGHDPDMFPRLLQIQERGVAAAEEHNRHHREQGLPPAEPMGRLQ